MHWLIVFSAYQIRLLLLPNLVTYMQLLEPELQLEKQKNEMKRKEAWRVYGALLVSLESSVNIMFTVFWFTNYSKLSFIPVGCIFLVCCRQMLV